MPQTHKVLGQLNPDSTNASTLYTVPTAASAIVSSLVIANLASSSTTYRIAVRPSGESLANKHYAVFDASLPANDTTILTFGATMAATDVLTVRAGNTNVSFQVYGVEIT
jgi:hypothetical protein